MGDPPRPDPAAAEGPNRPDIAFRARFDEARRGQASRPDPLDGPAKRFRYVFVSGFHNEVMPFYFRGNLRELRRRGVPAVNLYRLHPSSHLPFDEVVDRLSGSLINLAEKGPEPIVIVAHSRGACASMAAALRNAPRFADRVEALFLIQGPFGGTAIADHVLDESADFPSGWPPSRLRLARSMATIERIALRLGWDEGLRQLTRESSRRFWAEEVRRHREETGGAGGHIERMAHFVTTFIDPARSRFPRSELGRILQESDGPNDGVVALRDQSIEGFGVPLGPIEAAHTDLVWGLNSTPGARNDRRALVAAILGVLARPREDRAAECS